MPTKTLVTTFDDARDAEHAVQKLQQDGFGGDDLGWVTRSPDGSEVAHGNLVVEQPKPAATERTAVGGLLGGLAGLLLGVTAITIAGVAGPIVIAGPAVGAAAGLGVGAAIGKRLDALVEDEQPIQTSHRYKKHLGKKARGAVMVTVSNEEEEQRALEILRGEASLHKREFLWRVPALADEGRPSKPSLW